jgi:serine-type D-Ala-D-Ala carboxypeptidase/endopeptidase (penicillin-binding protein 4)
MTSAVLLLAALAGTNPPSPKQQIDRILDRAEFASAFWGVEVRSLRTGAVLYSRNAAKSFHPASTLKLVTTAAALDVLGPLERVRTTVETAVPLREGILEGDLLFVGRGDPNLSGRFAEGRVLAPLEDLADQLVALGLKRVLGRLVGHEGFFKGGRRGAGWGWEDLVWWYGAEVSALSFNDNCTDLQVLPGAHPGDPVLVQRTPESSYVTVLSTATTSPEGTKSDLALTRELGSNLIRLTGTHPLGGGPAELNVAIEDPARYAATVFLEVLASKGIRVEGGVATSSEALPTTMRVLATHMGPPLGEMVKAVNKPSQNLHAEMLLRLLGVRAKGEGSPESGLDAVQDFLKRQHVDSSGWDLEDGSGLSVHDLVTPRGFVDLLRAMDHHPLRATFKESLPVAGVDGSLRNRMKGTSAEGHIIAKTGSVGHVSSLAGYAETKEPLVFAIFIDHDTSPPRAAASAIDEVCELLVAIHGERPRSKTR